MSMAGTQLFYVDVEEVTNIFIAVEAVNEAAAQKLAEEYVTGHVYPSEMRFLDRSSGVYFAEEAYELEDEVVHMDKGADPFAAATAHLRQAIRDIVGRSGLSKEDIVGAAKTVLKEFEAEGAVRPAANMGM